MYSHWTKAALIEVIERLWIDYNESTMQVERLETENQDLYDEIATLQAELEEKEDEIDRLSEENNNLSKEIQEYEDFYGEDYEGSILYAEIKEEF